MVYLVLNRVFGHSWYDFWYGVLQSVVAFAITGVLAFFVVRRLELSERAMAVTTRDIVDFSLRFLGSIMIVFSLFGGMALAAANISLEVAVPIFVALGVLAGLAAWARDRHRERQRTR